MNKEPCHWSGGTDHNMEQKHWVWCFTSFFSFTIRAILALKLIFFSSHVKKLVVLPSTACLGLKTAQGTGWTSEMFWWSFRFLSCMNIWKESIHIIIIFYQVKPETCLMQPEIKKCSTLNSFAVCLPHTWSEWQNTCQLYLPFPLLQKTANGKDNYR